MTRHRNKHTDDAFWNNHPGLFDTFDSDDADALLSPMADEAFEAPERLRFMSFGSGSSGNCSYIGTASCGLLIDAGVDNNFVTQQLLANSIDLASIRGILLTHDHGDHVRYAYAILRRNQHMRLYATPKALQGILRRHSMSRRIVDYHTPVYKEFPFKVGPLTVTAFETSHDGTDNAGFHIEGAGTSFVITTDTGTVTARADHYMRLARNLMIEANYDLEMLRNGRYPQYLKARIMGTSGHLDNADTARYLATIAPVTELRNIFLCHLSQDNNTPQIAISTVRSALEEAQMSITSSITPNPDPTSDRIHLSVLPRTACTPLIVLK